MGQSYHKSWPKDGYSMRYAPKSIILWKKTVRATNIFSVAKDMSPTIHLFN